MDTQILIEKCEAKARPHLEQYAPVWLVEQTVKPSEDAVLFNVLFLHNLYGWVIRRYRYDGFNDVLYYRGETTVSEEEALKLLQEKEPFVSALVANIPNSYGG